MPYLPLILGAFSLIEKLIPLIQQWRAAAKQNGELTPEQDAALDQRIKDTTSQPWWQPEQPTPGTTTTTVTTVTTPPMVP